MEVNVGGAFSGEILRRRQCLLRPVNSQGIHICIWGIACSMHLAMLIAQFGHNMLLSETSKQPG